MPQSTPNNEEEQSSAPAVDPHANSKYILDNQQLTSAGMRKLTRNWENCMARISRASDGELIMRRSSESNSSGSDSKSKDSMAGNGVLGFERPLKHCGHSNSGSSSSGRTCGSLDNTRAPWKPC